MKRLSNFVHQVSAPREGLCDTFLLLIKTNDFTETSNISVNRLTFNQSCGNCDPTHSGNSNANDEEDVPLHLLLKGGVQHHLHLRIQDTIQHVWVQCRLTEAEAGLKCVQNSLPNMRFVWMFLIKS